MSCSGDRTRKTGMCVLKWPTNDKLFRKAFPFFMGEAKTLWNVN